LADQLLEISAGEIEPPAEEDDFAYAEALSNKVI